MTSSDAVVRISAAGRARHDRLARRAALRPRRRGRRQHRLHRGRLHGRAVRDRDPRLPRRRAQPRRPAAGRACATRASPRSAGGSTSPAGSRPAGTSSAVYRFDPATGVVEQVATLPRPVAHAPLVALGGSLYLIGGDGSDADLAHRPGWHRRARRAPSRRRSRTRRRSPSAARSTSSAATDRTPSSASLPGREPRRGGPAHPQRDAAADSGACGPGSRARISNPGRPRVGGPPRRLVEPDADEHVVAVELAADDDAARLRSPSPVRAEVDLLGPHEHADRARLGRRRRRARPRSRRESTGRRRSRAGREQVPVADEARHLAVHGPRVERRAARRTGRSCRAGARRRGRRSTAPRPGRG